MVAVRKKVLKADTIRRAVFKAGVVGAGGAGFPTSIKLKAKADLIIANGVECEPLLFNDKHIMEDRAAEVLDGLRLAMTAVGATRGLIALKKKYSRAIGAMTDLLRSETAISLFFMDDYYPAGDEQEIVRAATGKAVPPGDIPLALGVVVSNVTTLYQISEAMRGRAVTHRFLSVVGAVTRPCTVFVPIGMSIGEVLEQTGNALHADQVILTGGVMMGTPALPAMPVNKTTTALVVLPADHPRMLEFTVPLSRMKQRAISACCQCQSCMEICPRYLLGHPLSPNKSLRSLRGDRELLLNAVLCSECGLCTSMVTCPMGISPRRMHQHIKQTMARQGIRAKTPWTSRGEHPLRDLRRISSHRLKEKLGILEYDREPLRSTASMKPTTLTLHFKQHIGISARPIIECGSICRTGDLLATISEHEVGAPVHCSSPGTVTDIGAETMNLSCGPAVPDEVGE